MRAEETEETTGHDDHLDEIKTVHDFNTMNPVHRIRGNILQLPNDATKAFILTNFHDIIVYARGLEQSNAKLEAGCQKLTQEKAELTAALQATKKKNDKDLKEIHNVCKQKVFARHKFIPNEEDEQKAALLCYQYICEDNKVDPLADPTKTKLWVARYLEDVTSAIADERGYIQQRMWHSLRLFVVKHKFMPNLALMSLCANRNIDMKNEQQRATMEWYWTDLAGAFCAECS